MRVSHTTTVRNAVIPASDSAEGAETSASPVLPPMVRGEVSDDGGHKLSCQPEPKVCPDAGWMVLPGAGEEPCPEAGDERCTGVGGMVSPGIGREALDEHGDERSGGGPRGQGGVGLLRGGDTVGGLS